MGKKLLLLTLSWLLAGCAELSYYAQSLGGHFEIVRQARPIEDWLADAHTGNALAQRLKQVLALRDFADEQLDLPVGDSYREYADIGRPWVVKNLYAAPEFALRLKTWCHPFAGCIAYRGYFDEVMLEKEAESLRQQGMDVHVGKVAAYSTLGWFDDPVLNTFVYWSDPGLAGLLFHELAHRRVYVDDDSSFNEAYATAVQQAGVEAWLRERGQEQALKAYRQRLANRRRVLELIREARQDLAVLYAEALSTEQKRRRKQIRLERLRQDYERLSAHLDGDDGFRQWMVSGLNNAKLLSLATYQDAVPDFLALLERLHGNFAAFHRAVERLGKLPRGRRMDCLRAWAGASAANCPSLAEQERS